MIIQAILLGIIEGLTEFLPISSTGHLIIANRFIHFSGEFANTFDVVIQVGAVLAVIIYFRHKLFPSSNESIIQGVVVDTWMKVFLGFIPSAMVGLLFADVIDRYLFNPTSVSVALIVGGIILLFTERIAKQPSTLSIDQVSYKQAFLIGMFQCYALFPGMSRSASTIIGGLCKGLSREAAAEFSFMLGIPTLIAAAVLKLVRSELSFSSYEWLLLTVGTLVSFITAFVVISFLLQYLKNRTFAVFGWYRIIAGILILFFASAS